MAMTVVVNASHGFLFFKERHMQKQWHKLQSEVWVMKVDMSTLIMTYAIFTGTLVNPMYICKPGLIFCKHS